jgi:transposase
MLCKDYQEKLFANFQLSERIPAHNFYRRLLEVLDLHILTKPYYGGSGQKSIDPVVFYKLCLIGYLENMLNFIKQLKIKVLKRINTRQSEQTAQSKRLA